MPGTVPNTQKATCSLSSLLMRIPSTEKMGKFLKVCKRYEQVVHRMAGKDRTNALRTQTQKIGN